MHTISMLRRSLGLSSDNQVRNRIERIKSLLAEHIRRGPNNQIFLTDAGLELLKQLQELYDSGLTLTEASNVLRSKIHYKQDTLTNGSTGFAQNAEKPNQQNRSLIVALHEEMTQIRDHIAALEAKLSSDRDASAAPDDASPWWVYLREDVDVP